MFQDAYVKVDKDETKKYVETLKPHLEGSFDASSTIIMARPLPFYKDSTFLDIADHKTMPPARRFVIMVKGKPTVIDFTNKPIYELNAAQPIRLSEDTVIDYVRFFFSYVRGRHGRFLIIESIDDIAWREEPAPSGRKAIAKMITPITIEPDAGTGSYHLTAHLLFKDSLFHAHLYVTSQGEVKITEETLLIEDIPVIDDTLGQ